VDNVWRTAVLEVFQRDDLPSSSVSTVMIKPSYLLLLLLYFYTVPTHKNRISVFIFLVDKM
jgi:hypothetical protein